MFQWGSKSLAPAQPRVQNIWSNMPKTKLQTTVIQFLNARSICMQSRVFKKKKKKVGRETLASGDIQSKSNAVVWGFPLRFTVDCLEVKAFLSHLRAISLKAEKQVLHLIKENKGNFLPFVFVYCSVKKLRIVSFCLKCFSTKEADAAKDCQNKNRRSWQKSSM